MRFMKKGIKLKPACDELEKWKAELETQRKNQMNVTKVYKAGLPLFPRLSGVFACCFLLFLLWTYLKV